jgi:PST family polysaccharide transporter
MAQAFAMYGSLVVEYGFVYSGTRRIAAASSSEEIERTVAGVSAAKALLTLFVISGAFLAYAAVPLFHRHPLLFWSGVVAEIIKASLPTYYFYGVKRVVVASVLDISARVAAAAGIFFFVHRAEDAWIVFALQGIGALAATVIGHGLICSRFELRWPGISEGWKMLTEGRAMFLFRSAHNLYLLGNAFILGLFASPQSVGYYAGAEKINSAAVNLLSPMTTALYPRAVGLVKTSLPRAARLTVVSLYVMCGSGLLLALVMWFGSTPLVRIILGQQFLASASALKVLSLRAPMVAWINVLGFQWLLALDLEKSFQQITVVALCMNIVLATILAPRYTFNGMAWAVVISQAAAVVGIYMVLRRRKLNPFVKTADPSYV